MKALRRALGYLKPYWLTVFGALFSLVIVTVANLAAPQILRVVIDQGVVRQDMTALFWAALVLVLVALLRGLFTFTQGFWSEQASQHIAYDMRNTLFAKIQNLSFSYHDRAQTGQLMTRITSDVEQVRSFVGAGLLQLLSAVAMLLGSVITLLVMNWQLALVALLVVPAMMVVLGSFITVIRPLFGEIQTRLSALNTVLQENLAGIRVVQSFAREPYEAERYTQLNNALLEANLSTVQRLSSSFPLLFLISNLGTLGVIWFGGYQVIGGVLSLGELVAFTAYLALLTMPVMMIGFIAAQLTRAIVSAERVFEVLDAKIDVDDKPDAAVLPMVRGRVAFEDVSFGYGVHLGEPKERESVPRAKSRKGAAAMNGGAPAMNGHGMGGDGVDQSLILKHVSFVAEPGQLVAILGPTGSGKSTIINLIPRFYDVVGGHVRIDDYDVRDVTLESLRAHIGIVLQDTTLFSGSIRDNIAYGRPEATDAQVEAAARAAQAHEFISELPDTYATIVGERGIGLSGGQRQRIAIARALLTDPRILILDDSTSAVDAETEYQIQQALTVLMEGRTSFVIAQRISTVRRADLILLLEKGRIVAQGTHDDLLRDSPLYGDIIDSQFGGDLALREELEEVQR